MNSESPILMAPAKAPVMPARRIFKTSGKRESEEQRHQEMRSDVLTSVVAAAPPLIPSKRRNIETRPSLRPRITSRIYSPDSPLPMCEKTKAKFSHETNPCFVYGTKPSGSFSPSNSVCTPASLNLLASEGRTPVPCTTPTDTLLGATAGIIS